MTVKLDTLKNGTLSVTRDATGFVVEARRTAQVTAVEGTTFSAWMTSVMAQLPAHGSEIVIAGTTLNLEDTVPTLRDRGVADVELIYRYQERAGGAALRNALQMASALQVVKTSKDYTVDPPAELRVPYNNGEESLTGDYDLFAPQNTIEVALYEKVASPWTIPQLWTRKVNESAWAGGEPGTWMCMGVDITPANLNALPLPEWRFLYHFQYDETGWDPEVIVIDPETGGPYLGYKLPAPGQVDGNAAKRLIGTYKTLDFSTKFS